MTTKNIQPGYKQTEVGVIPEDWEVRSIYDIAPLQRGYDLTKDQIKRGKYPVVYSNGVENYHDKYLHKAPGVITGRSGTIGKVHFVNENYWPHNTTLWVTDFKGNSPQYIYHLYTSLNFKRFSTGSGVPTLNRNILHSCLIPLPPKSEQTAIATALSDMDALIAAQEQLIAKKRAIKQGAMQELLEAKEGWEEIKLGQIGRFSSSSVDKIYRENDYEVFLLNYMDVYRNKVITPTKIPSRTTANATQLKNHDLRKGDVLFTPTSETPDDIGHSALILHDLSETVFSYHLMRLRFNDNKLLDEFKPYILNSQSLSQYFFEKATGSTRYVLKKSDFENAPITIPSTIKEQTRIAQILSDMDAEIEQLGKELAKYRDMKKGMMEELLTGRKRLTF